MDASRHQTNDGASGRRSRVVLAPLGWRQVGDDALHRADDGDSNVTDTGESTKETVKTTRAGKAGSCSVEPVVTTARMLFHFACEAAGAASTRLSPRPLFCFEGSLAQTRARSRRGKANLCFFCCLKSWTRYADAPND